MNQRLLAMKQVRRSRRGATDLVGYSPLVAETVSVERRQDIERTTDLYQAPGTPPRTQTLKVTAVPFCRKGTT